MQIRIQACLTRISVLLTMPQARVPGVEIGASTQDEVHRRGLWESFRHFDLTRWSSRHEMSLCHHLTPPQWVTPHPWDNSSSCIPQSLRVQREFPEDADIKNHRCSLTLESALFAAGFLCLGSGSMKMNVLALVSFKSPVLLNDLRNNSCSWPPYPNLGHRKHCHHQFF